jgi:hypothetical protein
MQNVRVLAILEAHSTTCLTKAVLEVAEELTRE